MSIARARQSGPAVSVRIPPCAPIQELHDMARECERLGFHGVWFPDSQLLWRDAFLTSAAALAGTKRLRVGVAVTNLATRHPTVVANLIRTLDEDHPERFRVGIGAGSSSTGTVGLPSSRTSELRDGMNLLRGLARGEPWDFGAGPQVQVGSGPLPSIYLAATGPRNLRLAGELADGVMMLNGADHHTVARSLSLVAEGEANRPPERGPIQRVVTAFCLPTDDPERDVKRLKPLCVAMAQHLGAGEALAAAGINVSAAPPRHPVLPDLLHPLDWNAAITAVDDMVSDADTLAFGNQFCLFGPHSLIAERIAAMGELGITEIVLQELESFTVPWAWTASCARLLAPASTE